MVASPDVQFIYDGDGSQYGLEGHMGQIALRETFEEHFEQVD